MKPGNQLICMVPIPTGKILEDKRGMIRNSLMREFFVFIVRIKKGEDYW